MRFTFCFLQLAGAAARERFRQIEEGEAIERARYESVYLQLELARSMWEHRCSFECSGTALTLNPPKRYGFKIYRYANETCGPSLRMWWGTWKPRRRILWGKPGIPSYEGELLADAMCGHPFEPVEEET
jgi:hypothetical protein